MPKLKKNLYRKLGYRQLTNTFRSLPSPDDGEGQQTGWFQFDVTPLDSGYQLIS